MTTPLNNNTDPTRCRKCGATLLFATRRSALHALLEAAREVHLVARGYVGAADRELLLATADTVHQAAENMLGCCGRAGCVAEEVVS